MASDPSAERAFAELGAALREATRRLHTLRVPADERLRLTRRLLAITNVGKRDVTVAAARLRKLRQELDGLAQTADPDEERGEGDKD